MTDPFESSQPQEDPLFDDPPSEEDLSDLIRANIGDIESNTGEIPEKTAREMSEFFSTIKVKGSEDMTNEDLEIIWTSLLKDHSLAEDFTFALMDRKARLNYCEYPMAIKSSDLIEYAVPYVNPQGLRVWFADKIVPNLVQHGVKERRAYELALTEIHGPNVAKNVRFLGWLAGQGFMKAVHPRLVEEQKNRNLKITNLAAHTTLEVMDHLKLHRSRRKEYHRDRDMEQEAYEHSHTDVITALEGLYKLCQKRFLGEPTQQ